MRQILYTILLLLFLPTLSFAQYFDEEDKKEKEEKAYLKVDVEAQASLSDGKTPLWLNANKHGLSSLEESNGYLRASAIHRMQPFDAEDEKPFDYAFGLDLAAAYGYTSTLIIQQAYGEVRWLRGKLTIGSKNWDMELKDNNLSSGSQTLGINARPVPQVRLALDEFWPIPGTKGFLNLKGHIAYGMMTDNNWQKDFTKEQSKYTQNALYHSKAGYLKLGKEYQNLSLTLGAEMVTIFGGTSYIWEEGVKKTVGHRSDLKAFWNAFLPTSGEGEVVETTYQNVAGNMLGSLLARVDYKNDYWKAGLYLDHFFEDHSQMFFVDYDGYGIGDEWQTKKDRKYFMYSMKDMMLGFDWKSNLPSWFDSMVFEYIYTKYQSGPIYHDHTQNISEHICGKDNYYNHYLQAPYQHWGQVMGNPLYLSPIYNDDNQLEVKNNRFVAYHLGFGGHPTDELSYRILATFQDGMGTYLTPYDGYKKSFNLMAEATYQFPKNWQVTAAIGIDRGNIHGNNSGAQLTIRKTIYK
ncbi:MAG: hypothetical protein HUK07_00210 [Bacteroidaceae bacterium]|nr:hypothetical protein [Bacteroidaceae bacterium]